MNRRIDVKLRDVTQCVNSLSFQELQKSVVPDSKGRKRVSKVFVSCKDISKTILDPDLVTMENFIKTGIPVDPKSLVSYFSLTDPEDLQRIRESKAQNLVNYVKDHEREILDEIGKVKDVKEIE